MNINPFELEKLKMNLSIPEIQGVYFLFDSDNELIYIGKSKNILKRCIQHASIGRFWFDYVKSISFIPCDNTIISELEHFYIDKYLPIYNYESGSKEYDDPVIQRMSSDIERKFREGK